jgi:Holliday junction DNA helicase RuvB
MLVMNVDILKDPNIIESLKRIIAHEEKTEAEHGHALHWDWQEVAVPWQIIRKLLLSGYLDVIGGVHKAYLLKDRQAVKQLIQEAEAMEEEAEERLEVPADLFSPILGYDDVKELVKKSLEGEKPTGFLLVGPVATAKSLFLEELNRIRGSSYHLGSTATKAGLTQFLLEAKPKILLIDEFDKMKREDYAALLSLMESGKVVETKYGRRHEEYMNVWVFASCNNLRGIPPENISRFRPYVFHFREYTVDEFKTVVKMFLVEREGADPDLANYIAEKVSAYTRDVRAARGLARLCRNKEDVDRFINTILKYQGFF